MKPAKIRNEEALQVIDDYLRWLGTGEFEEVYRVLSNLQAQLSGEPLNGGTPGLADHCVISGLREQLYRRRQSHPDDLAVDRFAAAMKRKMAKQRAKGYAGWDGPTCAMEHLQEALFKHLPKGDPVDVGNFAMMLWNRGEPTACEAQWMSDLAAIRCPATGMKPDACSDRSQCLEACGQHGHVVEISAAVATMHAPNGIVHACERHASTARLQASFLSTHAYVDEAPAGTPCTYCTTRLERGA